MNLHKYDTLNQEIQVTLDYGYITNSEISQCQVTITIAVPSNNYQTGLGPSHRTTKYNANEVGRTHETDWTQRSPQIQRIESTHNP